MQHGWGGVLGNCRRLGRVLYADDDGRRLDAHRFCNRLERRRFGRLDLERHRCGHDCCGWEWPVSVEHVTACDLGQCRRRCNTLRVVGSLER